MYTNFIFHINILDSIFTGFWCQKYTEYLECCNLLIFISYIFMYTHIHKTILNLLDTDSIDFRELFCPYKIMAGTYLVHSCIKVSLTLDWPIIISISCSNYNKMVKIFIARLGLEEAPKLASYKTQNQNLEQNKPEELLVDTGYIYVLYNIYTPFT